MFLVNGEECAVTSVLDRGLAYGDGLFETIRIADGAPQLLDEHIHRLASACQKLRLPAAMDRIRAEALALCRRARSDNVLKIIVTRGDGGAYRAPRQVECKRILITDRREPWPQSRYTDGVRVRICAHRLGHNSRLAGLKHLNRLDQVLARQEWDDEYAEGLMLDQEGLAIEGTMSNILLRENDTIATPSLERAGVRGVMLERALRLAARASLRIEETAVSVDRLLRADYVWVCNSLIGVCPVRSIDGRDIPVKPCDREAALCGEMG